ncbi:hypothetical protein BIW11_12133, partial [Tropilaelaps mercedesae]
MIIQIPIVHCKSLDRDLNSCFPKSMRVSGLLHILLTSVVISQSVVNEAEAAISISSEWENEADLLYREFPSFGPSWLDIDARHPSDCSNEKHSSDHRVLWATHLTRCLLRLLGRNVPCVKDPASCDIQAMLLKDPLLKDIFTVFLNETDSFCGYISALKRMR